MPKLAILLIYLLLSGATQGQQRIIRGRVLDADANPLSAVTIQLSGHKQVALSGVDGRFTLSSPPGNVTLTAALIGYVSQTVRVKEGVDSVTTRLPTDTRTLDEVVVVGYRTESKRTITGAVATIPAGRSRGESRSTFTPGTSAKTVSSVGIVTVDKVRFTGSTVQAGQLTAGEIHDYSKWTLWQDISKNELKTFSSQWHMTLTDRYSVQLVTADGYPAIDVPIRLLDEQRQVIWQTRTDNTGRAELWRSDTEATMDPLATKMSRTTSGKLTVEATVSGQTYTLNRPHLFGKGNNLLTVGQPCQGVSPVVDVAFVVDATGSMGDEITYLKAELTDVINQSKQAVPGSTIRLASVFYRDKTDEYLTRHRDFSDQPDSTVAFIKQQSAGGGGDYPEAVDAALDVALSTLSWSKAAKSRLLFLVLDAPPHDEDSVKTSLQRSIAKAAALGVRLIPIAASGIDKSTEYLLRSMALGTNGTYVFLTDDSGIGMTHIKPTTDSYTVEKLNALLVRLITKFTQTPDCKPIAGQSTSQVRYTEQGQPIDATAQTPPTGAEPSFRYFPNPTRDFLTIESQETIRELFVMDITGKVLMRERPGEGTVRLNMLPYPTGTYLFRFDAAQTWQDGRFLLNK